MYVNYGDGSFFDYGMLVDDRESENGKYYILCCFPYEELDVDGDEVFLFGDCMVNINDSWISKERIENFIGYKKEEDPIQYAIGCIEYYGVENFNGGDPFRYTKQEICDILKHKMIASDSLNIEW